MMTDKEKAELYAKWTSAVFSRFAFVFILLCLGGSIFDLIEQVNALNIAMPILYLGLFVYIHTEQWRPYRIRRFPPFPWRT